MKPYDGYFEKEQLERKKSKPQAEEEINALLTGERQKNALDFVAFVKSLRMTPQWTSVNSWAVSYKGKRVCYIKLIMRQEENAWYIRPVVQYDEALRDFCREEQLEASMLENVHSCVGCGKCKPGTTVTFFEKELKHVCSSPIDFEFHNPDAEALECAKKLVEYRRAEIAGKA